MQLLLIDLKGTSTRSTNYWKCCETHRKEREDMWVSVSTAQNRFYHPCLNSFVRGNTTNIYIGTTELTWNAPGKTDTRSPCGCFILNQLQEVLNLRDGFILYFTIKWLIWSLIFTYMRLLSIECHFQKFLILFNFSQNSKPLQGDQRVTSNCRAGWVFPILAGRLGLSGS